MYWNELFENDNEIVNRKLFEKNFTKTDGIYSFNSAYSQTQTQTEETFGYKWSREETYGSSQVDFSIQQWLTQKYFDGSAEERNKYIKEGAKLLDAGCGAGVSSLLLFGDKINDVDYLGVDISEAIYVARKRFEDNNMKGEFLRASLTELPFAKPCFDVIFSEGVLHHTDSTEKAFKYLSGLLLPGGVIMIYVYRKKPPVREYTDDLIREHLMAYDNEQSWSELLPLTKLGKTLGDLDIEIDIEEDIPYLGIASGKINLQRFFYYNVCKMFYRSDWSLEEMNHVNFDWFKPLNCHRHTEAEVSLWCEECGLDVERLYAEPSGITLIARRK